MEAICRFQTRAWLQYYYARAEYYINTILRMGRLLYVGSYLQVMWWVLGQ